MEGFVATDDTDFHRLGIRLSAFIGVIGGD
jgi:hypothetical protein